MHLLLDTHALLWALTDDDRLGPAARDVITDRRNLVLASAASAWEIAIKAALGKLRAPDDLADQLDDAGFEPLSISVEHALAVGRLPDHHRDPFDRILLAQAMTEELTLLSRDPVFRRYDVALLSPEE